mgnify:CR=1 FL=1
MAKREKKVKYRRVIQLVFAAISNSYLTGFATGTLYKGNLKMVCNPGLNCYSCPGAVMSCPMPADADHSAKTMPNAAPTLTLEELPSVMAEK